MDNLISYDQNNRIREVFLLLFIISKFVIYCCLRRIRLYKNGLNMSLRSSSNTCYYIFVCICTLAFDNETFVGLNLSYSHLFLIHNNLRCHFNKRSRDYWRTKYSSFVIQESIYFPDWTKLCVLFTDNIVLATSPRWGEQILPRIWRNKTASSLSL